MNKDIAHIFEMMADLMEFRDENRFKVNAYRRAARVLEDLSEDVREHVKRGDLKELSGIGEAISQKITEFSGTGKIKAFEELRRAIPAGILDILTVPGMGPKKARRVYKNLGIKTLEDLKKAIQEEKLRNLPGMGVKTEENILRGIRLLAETGKRRPLGIIVPVVNELIEEMKVRKITKVYPVGSFRRSRESIGDVDLLAVSGKGEHVIDVFTKLPRVKTILASGTTKGSVILDNGLQADLRVVSPESEGAALQYFTGSKEHNVKIREIAKAKGMKVNEYGVYKGGKKVGGKNEEDIYKTIGLDWIPPELRENRGEIEAARARTLPKLIALNDIRGEFHVHSTWSDGQSSIEEVAEAAYARGYQYVGIADHSVSLRIAGGLSEEDVQKKLDEIKKIRKKMPRIHIFSATEVDIKSDGKLDYSDRVLESFDIVIASIHMGFKGSREAMTSRLCGAMENPHVDIIGHPTGRHIGSREPYDADMKKVFRVSRETKTLLEINSQTFRMDLNDIHVRQALDAGVSFAINTDAHHTDQLWMMALGVGIARRGWVAPQHVINTRSLGDVARYFATAKEKRVPLK